MLKIKRTDYRFSMSINCNKPKGKKVFYKQTVDHEYTSYLLLKIPTWNRSLYAQTKLIVNISYLEKLNCS